MRPARGDLRRWWVPRRRRRRTPNESTNRSVGIDSTMKLFAGLDSEEMQAVQRYLTPVSFRAGTVLTTQGATCRQFIVIVDGTVGLTRNGLPVAVLERGHHFGEVPLLDADDRTHRVGSEAITDVTVAVANPRELSSLLHQLPLVGERVERLAELRTAYLEGRRRETLDRPPSSPRPKRRLELEREGREADVLVVADRTLGGLSAVSRLAELREHDQLRSAHVIVPAPQSKSLKRHPSVGAPDLEIVDHEGLDAAQERLDLGLRAYRASGLFVRGEVANSDPFIAVQDAMRRVAYDRILIVGPGGSSLQRAGRGLARRVAKAYPRAMIETLSSIDDDAALAAVATSRPAPRSVDDQPAAAREAEPDATFGLSDLVDFPISVLEESSVSN